MRYRYSLNEIQSLCKKAAEGVGIPAGLDDNIAKQVTCLLSYEFPVLDSFVGSLEQAEDKATYRLQAGELNVKDKSGVLIAPALVDVLVAKASTALDNCASLIISDLSAPIFLLPNAVNYSVEDWHFSFYLKQQDQLYFVFTITAGDNSEIIIFHSTDLKADTSALYSEQQFTVECYFGKEVQMTKALPILFSNQMLKNARTRSLTQGIFIADDTYRQLSHYASKALVPATEESRLKGAGAISDDSQ